MEKVMPYQVVLELTDACNLKCIHCYAKSKEKGIFLSYSSIKNLIKELKELCTKKIILTGGEPFLHKDLKKIIKLIDKSGMVTSIRTNGILINQEMINFLTKIGNIDWITVGVYWNDKEIKNKKSAFNKSLDSIHLLHENGIEVYASLTFMKSNFDTIPIMIDKIKKNGVDTIVFSTHLDIGRGKATKNLKLNMEEFQSIIGVLKRRGFSLEQLLHSRGDFNPLNLITTSSFCGVGSSFCTILPDGSIIPCPLFRSSKFIAGNINEGFKKVWEKSEVLKKFRLSINEISKCKACKWKMKCLGGCRAQAYQYFGDIKKPDPESCAIFKVFNELKT